MGLLHAAENGAHGSVHVHGIGWRRRRRSRQRGSQCRWRWSRRLGWHLRDYRSYALHLTRTVLVHRRRRSWWSSGYGWNRWRCQYGDGPTQHGRVQRRSDRCFGIGTESWWRRRNDIRRWRWWRRRGQRGDHGLYVARCFERTRRLRCSGWRFCGCGIRPSMGISERHRILRWVRRWEHNHNVVCGGRDHRNKPYRTCAVLRWWRCWWRFRERR